MEMVLKREAQIQKEFHASRKLVRPILKALGGHQRGKVPWAAVGEVV